MTHTVQVQPDPSPPSRDSKKSTNGRSFFAFRSLPFRATRVGVRCLSWVSPQTAATLAEQVFRTPRRHRRPDREHIWLRAAKPVRVRLGTRHVRAWVWGPDHGPTTLLVHGWEGRGAQLGALAEPLVGRGQRVVAFDAPAHGDSPGRVSSLPEFIDAIWAVTRHLGSPQAIAAHSFGAAATIAALREGLAVPRVALVAPPADLGDALSRFSQAMGISTGVRARLEAQLERRFGDLAPIFRLAHAVSHLEAHGLIVHDLEDREVPVTEGKVLAERWADDKARIELTTGLGHRRILRDPQVVAQIVSFVT
ncbi:MAG: alpha/beta fold hydrolase [Myxococcales bacterium FL481]|nr:MAG: alpha/beta fold hydrolase [Myxococcales bacterium FL481]